MSADQPQARPPHGVGPAARLARSRAADQRCRDAYAAAGAPDSGVALVAVGGYGREELAPHSDLDVVLVGEGDVDLNAWAHAVWEPLWDRPADPAAAHHRLDHAVRTLAQMQERAAADVRVGSGLLDVRHVAGDPGLTLRLRSLLLAQWRRDARRLLPELAALTRRRHDTMGELAHASVPDLKECEGGLRDATVLRGLVATWLVDVPAAELERSRLALLDVRDAVHLVSGRATDRVAPEVWSGVAEVLGIADERTLQTSVREQGRRLAHLSHVAWRRVDAVLAGPAVRGRRRPEMVPLAPGIALSGGEVVLTQAARPERDATLLLRCAALAAERDVPLSPVTAARLVRECPALPDPWPGAAREALVRLLAAGPGLRGVWATLEETGATQTFLPEWDRVRLLPHASTIHRWTVDRHMVETCVEASALIRRVARPDVLMVAALLHDIGKGGLTEHSVAGAPVARAIASRIGFDDAEADLVATLVRHHLLLSAMATGRDAEDPETRAQLRAAVRSPEALALLHALTEADARATAAQAWTDWRASLVAHLVSRVSDGWDGDDAVAAPAPAGWEEEWGPLGEDPLVQVVEHSDGATVVVAAVDRVGLLADVAASLALLRTSVRSARAWEDGRHGLSSWEVSGSVPPSALLRDQLRTVASGEARLDRLKLPGDLLEPGIVVHPDASRTATVMEVRTGDRPGVVHHVCAALASIELSVRSAHIDTLGPQAVDVFYLTEPGAGALTDARAAEAAHAVRAALTPVPPG